MVRHFCEGNRKLLITTAQPLHFLTVEHNQKWHSHSPSYEFVVELVKWRGLHNTWFIFLIDFVVVFSDYLFIYLLNCCCHEFA